MPNREKKADAHLLDVQDLCMTFGSGASAKTVVRKISFHIDSGETFGLVGESGSGKTTIGRCIIGLHQPSAGSIRFDGTELTDTKSRKVREKRTEIQMIFQDPMSSLNPRKRVRDIIGAGLDIEHKCSSAEERSRLIDSYLKKVGLSPEQGDRYPAQFSGGQRQRVGIARALIMQPKLIIADECIAALDASIQAQVVNLLKKLCKETDTSLLFISHDLSMVHYLSDRIGVLHLGYLLETGDSDAVFEDPIHPYTKNLLAAVPRPDPIMQHQTGEGYDPVSAGIIYENGSWHSCEKNPSHRVWCTDAEWKKWGDGK